MMRTRLHWLRQNGPVQWARLPGDLVHRIRTDCLRRCSLGRSARQWPKHLYPLPCLSGPEANVGGWFCAEAREL